MNRVTVVLLCLMLSLTGFTVPEVSAASRSNASAKSALISFLQEEYLIIDDAGQIIFTRYPILTAFRTVSMNRLAMMIALRRSVARNDVVASANTRAPSVSTMEVAVAGVSGSGAVAINLEQSVAPVTTKPSKTTLPTPAKSAQAHTTKTSLGSRTTIAATVKTTPPPATLLPTTQPDTPSLTPPPTTDPPSAPAPAPILPTQRVVSFTPSQSVDTFLTLLGDESADAIELTDGTYHLPYVAIDIDRTRPIVVRPAAGATVVMSGAHTGFDPQFGFGFSGKAGNITMQGLVFDGFILGQQGIIQALDCHDITLNDMVVRNSRADGTYAKPYHAWAIYLTATQTVVPTNFTANRWTIEGSARGMSALQVYGGSHVTAIGWSVSNVFYAVYASSSRGPLTNLVLDDWTISDTGGPTWGVANVSVAIENASGQFSNMHATASGGLLNMGVLKMVDGGGNSW
jgi:hypothetical protein